MIDPKLLRGDLRDLQQQLATRGYALDMAFWQSIENERKSLQVKTEELQSRRNAGAKQVGALKNRAQMPANCWLRCKVSAVRLRQLKMSCVPCKGVLAKRPCKSQISQPPMCSRDIRR